MSRVNEFTPLKDVIQVMVESKPLAGKCFCISGHLGRVREEIVELIVHCGGRTEDSVKWGVTHLLSNADWSGKVGEGGKGKVSSKFKKAQEMRITIINEKQFYELLAVDES